MSIFLLFKLYIVEEVKGQSLMLITQNYSNIADKKIGFALHSSDVSNFNAQSSVVQQPAYPQVSNEKLVTALNAYNISPQKPEYKEIENFEVPNVGAGKIFELKNGHKVIIVPKEGNTAIYTHVKVGFDNENKKNAGISHLLEHLTSPLFEFEKMGAGCNASTGNTETSYYATFPVSKPEELDKILQIQSKVIKNSDISDEEMAKEKKIIISEQTFRKEKKKDNYYDELLVNNLLNTKNFSIASIETEESVKNITKKDLLEHRNTYYTPDNMVTTIVGNVNYADTIKAVSKYFNVPARQPEQTKYTTEEPDYFHPIQSPKRADVVADKEGNSVEVKMAFAGPQKISDKDVFTAKMLIEVLAGRKYSPLNKPLKPFDVRAEMSSSVAPNKNLKNPPIFLFVDASFKKGKEEDGLKALYTGISHSIKTPVSEKELKIAANSMKRTYSALSDYSILVSRLLGEEYLKRNNLNYYINSSKMIDSVTAEDVQNFAKRTLDLNKVSMVIVHPKPEKAKANKVGFGFSGAVNAIDTKYISEYQLPNNLRVVIDHSPRVKRTVLTMEAASQQPLKTKPMVPEMAAFMFQKTTKNYSNEQINDICDETGISVDTDTNKKSINAEISCDADKTLFAIDFAKEILFNPDFSQAKLNKAKEAYSDSYDKPKYAGFYAYNEISGGENQRNIDSYKNVNMADIHDYYNKILSNAQAQVVLTIPDEVYQKQGGAILASLNKGFPPLKPYQLEKPEIKKVDKPLQKTKVFVSADNDSDKAIVSQAFAADNYVNVKDRAVLNLMVGVLGGHTKSRLSADLREKQGIVYSVDSKLSSLNDAYAVKLHTSTAQGNLKPVLEGFNNNLKALAEKPVSKEELDIAKVLFKQETFSFFETPGSRNAALYGHIDSLYSINYYNEQLKVIDEVKPEDIQKMAQIVFNKPSVIAVNANQQTLDKNKDCLASFGEVVVCKKEKD
jgi:zinc protease